MPELGTPPSGSHSGTAKYTWDSCHTWDLSHTGFDLSYTGIFPCGNTKYLILSSVSSFFLPFSETHWHWNRSTRHLNVVSYSRIQHVKIPVYWFKSHGFSWCIFKSAHFHTIFSQPINGSLLENLSIIVLKLEWTCPIHQKFPGPGGWQTGMVLTRGLARRSSK